MAYSILIKNGTLLDGSGAKAYAADVGIKDGVIGAVGPADSLGGSAEAIIDASDHFVAPGFIDITSHSDTYGTIFSSPFQTSLLMQGVTTALLGNCGESLAPITSPKSLEDLERWRQRPFSVDWNSIPEYYDALQKGRPGINIGTLVGQETLQRNAAYGDDRLILLFQAMKDGAWGFSSNFSFKKWDKTAENETSELLKVVAKFNGLYKIHLHDEGKDFLPSLAAILNVVRSSGVRTVISHFKSVGRSGWADFADALKMMRIARREKLDISFDFFPYLRTGSMLMSFLPDWARGGSNKEILARLNNPSESAKILAELRGLTLHPDRIIIGSTANDKNPIGKTLEELARATSLSAEEAVMELLKINDLNVSVLSKNISGKNLLLAARRPYSILASDGAGYDEPEAANLPHPRSFGAFPRFFSVIAPKAEITSEEAVKKMTFLPARALGLRDRGLIKKGYVADIAVFKPDEFKDAATYKKPHQYALGMKFVIISGKLAVSQGILSAERFGEVLRNHVR